MNTKVVVIAGSVLVLGVGAFFYFKPKSKENKNLVNLDKGASSEGTSSGGAQSSGTSGAGTSSGNPSVTPAQLVEDVKKIAEAKKIASEINTLKSTRYKLSLQVNSSIEAVGQIAFNSDLNNNLKRFQLNILIAKIRKLTEDLKNLGYTEVNGSIVKIV